MALLHCQAGDADGRMQISCAKVVAADAAVRNGQDNIQNHGATGFTAEHDAHLYLKRAHLYGAMLGDLGHHRRALFACDTCDTWD
jgi:alkylation response protein AidB-like acyl-CoA dehydrogenase